MPLTRLFFGVGTRKPVYHPTDLLKWLPKGQQHHYRDMYSMAEEAKCWTKADGSVPQSIANVVENDVLETTHFENGVPAWGGGTSKTDLMAFVHQDVVGEEA